MKRNFLDHGFAVYLISSILKGETSSNLDSTEENDSFNNKQNDIFNYDVNDELNYYSINNINMMKSDSKTVNQIEKNDESNKINNEKNIIRGNSKNVVSIGENIISQNSENFRRCDSNVNIESIKQINSAPIRAVNITHENLNENTNIDINKSINKNINININMIKNVVSDLVNSKYLFLRNYLKDCQYQRTQETDKILTFVLFIIIEFMIC